MKRVFIIVFSVIAFSSISLMFLSSCSKDEECKVLVVAKDALDTNIVIQKAVVTLGPKNGAPLQIGQTDIRGEYSTTFSNAAYLEVNVELSDFYKGVASVRLIPGETVRVMVPMNQHN